MVETNPLDDLTLIQRFIDGRASLESNPNLRIESNIDGAQMFTKKGLFLAAVRIALNVRSTLVRQESQYWELISQILIENQWIPTGIIEQGLMRYEPCNVPQDFELNYSEARLLWRYWRTVMRSPNPSRAEQDLSRPLIQTSTGWQDVLGIEHSQELLFIKTADDEQMLHNRDRVVWLSPAGEQPSVPVASRSKTTLGNFSQTIDKV